MSVWPFLLLVLVAYEATVVSSMLLGIVLLLPLGLRPRRIDFGRPRVLRFRLGRLAFRVGPLPTTGGVRYAQLRWGTRRPRRYPRWSGLVVGACVHALQLAGLYAVLGRAGLRSFFRGIAQALWPWTEGLRHWIHALAARASSGLTPALVATIAAKMLAVYAVVVAGFAIARLGARFHRDPGTPPGVVLGLFVVLGAVWGWRIGAALIALS